MADSYISGLPVDSNNRNVGPQDVVPVVRNQTTYKADLGAALLPAATSNDAGKQLRVNASGNAAWQLPGITRKVLYTNTNGGGINVGLQLNAGERFDAWFDVLVGYGYGAAADSTWTYRASFFHASGRNNYDIGTLRGTGWAQIYTTGNRDFVITSSNSTLKVFSIVGVGI